MSISDLMSTKTGNKLIGKLLICLVNGESDKYDKNNVEWSN